MIHAYLFLTKKGYSRDGTDGHGPVNLNTNLINLGFQKTYERD